VSESVIANSARADGTLIPRAVAIGVFLSAYLSWRPSSDILFTMSDACFLFGAMQLLARRQVPLQPFGVLSPLWFGGFVLMASSLLISSLFAQDPTRWIIVALQYSTAWVMLPFLIMGYGVLNTHRLARILLFGVVVMEFIGIVVYHSFTGSFADARAILGLDFISGSKRLGAFATDANWNGATIAMALPFAYYLLVRRMITPLHYLIAISILFYALTLTASATAFFVAIPGFFVFFGLSGLRVRARSLAIVAALLALLAIVGLAGVGPPAVFQKRVANAVETGNLWEAGTFEGRMNLVKSAWQRVGESMVIGVGVDQDRVVSPLHAPVHNMYLLIWLEGGLLALAGWIIMMSCGLVIGFAAFARDRFAGALAITIMMTFLFFSAGSPHMYARLWAVPVLMALAIAMQAGAPVLRKWASWRYSAARWARLADART